MLLANITADTGTQALVATVVQQQKFRLKPTNHPTKYRENYTMNRTCVSYSKLHSILHGCGMSSVPFYLSYRVYSVVLSG